MSDCIPPELLDEILVRLPVQSLIRFTSVCKSWYSLITSPSFITKHLNHSKTNTQSLLVHAYDFYNEEERYLLCRGHEKFSDEFSELESPFGSPVVCKRILGSCSGLLCMVDTLIKKKCMVDTSSPRCIYLWNPSIRKLVTLPLPAMAQAPSSVVLGFDAYPTTHDYMVVLIAYQKKHQQCPPNVYLYTRGRRSWRGLASVGHPHYIMCYNCLQVFVRGAMHWIAYDRRVVDDFRSLIMSFNMGSQEFSAMMMPAALASQGHCPMHLFIMSYGESLAVVHRGAPPEGSCCIWVMKEYGVAESWAKLYNISLPGVLLDNIIGFKKNGDFMVSTIDSRLLRYDCETKTLTDTGFMTSCSGAFAAGTFMESLVLVEPSNEIV